MRNHLLQPKAHAKKNSGLATRSGCGDQAEQDLDGCLDDGRHFAVVHKRKEVQMKLVLDELCPPSQKIVVCRVVDAEGEEEVRCVAGKARVAGRDASFELGQHVLARDDGVFPV